MTPKKMGRDLSAARKTSCKRNSNAIALPNSIDEAIIGQQQANVFIRELRTEYASPDALFARFQELVLSLAQLRGFCRTLQKFIERVAYFTPT